MAKALSVSGWRVTKQLLRPTPGSPRERCESRPGITPGSLRAPFLRRSQAGAPPRVGPAQGQTYSHLSRSHPRANQKTSYQKRCCRDFGSAEYPATLRSLPERGEAARWHGLRWHDRIRWLGARFYVPVVSGKLALLGCRARSQNQASGWLGSGFAPQQKMLCVNTRRQQSCTATKHQELCDRFEIQLSASAKASPWQNGYMERWFGGFKLELGSLAEYRDLAQLHEAICTTNPLLQYQAHSLSSGHEPSGLRRFAHARVNTGLRLD